MDFAKNIHNTLFACLLLGLGSCSGNGFHLRNSAELPQKYRSIALDKLPAENEFAEYFRDAVEEAGGNVDEKASSRIVLTYFKEGKRVSAYTSERKAREYLLYLHLDYVIRVADTPLTQAARRIRLDRSFLYDADFALGKAEEEKQIHQNLYEEAARLILLRLQYATK